MKKRSLLVIVFFLVAYLSSMVVYKGPVVQEASGQGREGIPDFCRDIADPANVCIEESFTYFKAESKDERPYFEAYGFIYWINLEGSNLHFFVNSSDLIGDVEIYDPTQPDNQEAFTAETYSDRIVIIPHTSQFAYRYKAYYDPDYVGDTGFIVIFQSQVVNFGLPNADGEIVYYPVDYKDTITLPRGAGIVSYAPVKDAKLNQVGIDTFSLTWEYRNRKLDSKHDPLIIEITYSFDNIYLQFTKLLYQNQVEKQRLQDELQKLDILNASFQIIAFLAVIASLISILMAYLLARKKYEPEKKKAKELPRRQATDVERSVSMEIPVRKLFTSMVIIGIVIAAPLSVTVDAQPEADYIKWYGQYEIFRDNTIKLTVEITIPAPQKTFKIWENMSRVHTDTILIEDENGGRLPFTLMEDYILIESPPLTIRYSYVYDWTPESVKGMLVFLDRFWLEFYNPNNDPNVLEDNYFAAEVDYNVVLPKEAIVYSASPSDMVTRSTDPDGRKRVRFYDPRRQIDAFHDAWESQVSFSYQTIFEAIENLNVNYDNIKVEKKNTIEYIDAARSEILIFAILGLLAPLVSFLIAYWVFRNKYIKEIERLQQENEEQILVEAVQIKGFVEAVKKKGELNFREALLGHYYLLRDRISKVLKRDVTRMSPAKLEIEIAKVSADIDFFELSRLLDEGEVISSSDVDVSYEQLIDYAADVENILSQIRS